MNATETIRAAIDKLEVMGAAASDGPWMDHTSVGPYSIEAELFDGNGGYVIDDGYVDDVRLIAVLHRTIDAQLAILRAALSAGISDMVILNPDKFRGVGAVLYRTAYDLARAILGEEA